MNKLLYIITALLTLSLFPACGDDDNNEVVVLTSIAIDPVDKDLYIGDTYQLTVNHQPTEVKLPKLTWTSSDTKVATVSSSGKVTAVADGVADITAKYGDLSSSLRLVTYKIQDYTSFTIVTNENVVLTNSIAGYKIDNKYYKIADLGDLKQGIASKEIKIEDNHIKEIYLFSDYPQPSIKSDTIFVLKPNTKNRFELGRYTKGIEIFDKSDPTQYPQY